MDFGQRINEATNTKNTSYNTYNQYQQQADAAKGTFDQELAKRQSFGDIYNNARNQYMNTGEINTARNTFNEARDAVDKIGATINNLPASIRQQFGGTGLTEAQRQRALQHQMGAMQDTADHYSRNYANASQDYNSLMSRALQEAQFAATGQYQGQQDAINTLQNAWATLLGQRNTAYGQYQSDRDALAAQYGARDDWNFRQQAMELGRWKEQQANARAARYDLKKYLAGLNAGAGRDIPIPSAPKTKRVSAPKRDIGNDRIDDSAMYKSWREAPLWQKVFSAPIMMFKGY